MCPVKAPITREGGRRIGGGGGGGQSGRGGGDNTSKHQKEQAAAVPHFRMPDSVLGTGGRKEEIAVLP